MILLENQVLNQEFGNAYRGIKAPEALKKDTLIRMFAEEERLKQENGKIHKRKPAAWNYGVSAAALCAAVLVFAVLRPEGISYITPMEEGVFHDEVELEDGMIRFAPGRVVIQSLPMQVRRWLHRKNPKAACFMGKKQN